MTMTHTDSEPLAKSRHGRAIWSLIAAVLLVVIYLTGGYLDSAGDFGTGGVLMQKRQQILQPGLLWWHLGHYLLVNLICHFLFFYLLAEVARFREAGRHPVRNTLLLWGIGLLFLHVANSAFYPHSIWSFPLFFDLITGVVAAGMLVSLLLGGLALRLWRGWQRSRVGTATAGVLVAGLCLSLFGTHWFTGSTVRAASADKPDIIFIGVDGLRPDILAYMNTAWNPQYRSPMPFLDEQLQQSVVFTQSYTDVARTYPSWMEILTGQSPMRSGIRFNLQDDYDRWHGKMETLPQYLDAAGYQTAWAIDSSDFANIDQRHGFQVVMAPLMGAAGMLTGYAFSDLPVVNFLSNMRIGRTLLPLTYANRTRHYGYNPGTFSNWLDDFLSHGTDQRPLFLAVHFELWHYPDGWSNDGMPPDADPMQDIELWRSQVQMTFRRLDMQVQDLMQSLADNGRLDNAIVVFLSDHGNGLVTGKMGHDRFGNLVFLGDLSGGHGIDVSNLTQNHTLLAVRGFGRNNATVPGYHDNLVSLMDIAPTVLHKLGIEQMTPMEGQLLDLDGTQAHAERTLFFQSELYWVNQDDQGRFVTDEDNTGSEIAKMAHVYRIRRDGRISLREEVIPRLFELQFRAAFNGKHLIMRGPDLGNVTSVWIDKLQFPVYAVDIQTGEYTDPDANGFADPDIQKLALQFCRHYEQDAKYFTPPSFCTAPTPPPADSAQPETAEQDTSTM